MIRLLPLVVVLQIFCLYHAYKNNTDQKWFWFIIMLPFIGSLVYLYYHFFNRETVDTVSDTVTKAVNSNFKIEQLEKEVKFSATVSNKTLLANEYISIGDFEKAIFLYKSCLKGTHEDDSEILMGLVKSSYLNKNYDAVIEYAQRLGDDPVFQKSEERTAYAWALFNTGNTQKAEETFKAMDHQFSNYNQRLEYCNFLIAENKPGEAKEKLSGLIEEIDLMDRAEQRSKRTIYNNLKSLYSTI